MLRVMLAVPRRTRSGVRHLLARCDYGTAMMHPGYARHLARRRAVLVVSRGGAPPR
jgi:glyoxylate carboligase